MNSKTTHDKTTNKSTIKEAITNDMCKLPMTKITFVDPAPIPLLNILIMSCRISSKIYQIIKSKSNGNKLKPKNFD